MKTCSKCKIEKELTEFNKNKTKKDGLHNLCKSCVKEYNKEYYKENKDIIIKQVREYRAKNKSKSKEIKKKYYKKNKEQISKKRKEWYEKNRKEIRQRRNNHYQENLEYYREKERSRERWKTEDAKKYQKKYRQENKEKIKKLSREKYLKNRSKEVELNLIKQRKAEEKKAKLLKQGKKECRKCKKIKELNNFSLKSASKDGFDNLCKCCDKQYRYEYRGKENQRKIKEKIDKRNYLFSIGIKECSFCKQEKKISEYDKHKGKIFGLSSQCKKCVKKNRNLSYFREYEKNRRKKDPLYKMKKNLRARTWEAFKRQGYSKKSRTREMLGVDWEVTKQHIERQFTKGMSWDNYGEWHIDHIIPLASANNEEELKKLCHYSNLQPLWAEDNLEKKDKITGQQIKFRI